ncbi:pentapeptide repeat-containing protein [Haloarcula sp. S1CR25-12]|uniref:Pentapeptide repeat-containing protein n=1 Tax=Haloarcula saliterrae TaxID=2950534 RepID=A0ABU2FBS5_9EURY|nr:pentapeptide repeat-containing protein [Haloarcula sp. S1CR25-12]MDS0259300.1 pentapeptide repeat-containing protein [Haloarcula sp. S1CR25-12]
MSQVARDELEILGLSPAERSRQGLDAEDVTDALTAVLRHGTAEQKEFVGCTFPAMSLANQMVEPDETHPVVFRDCTFEGPLELTGMHLKMPVVFENCTFDALDAAGAWFEDDFEVRESAVRGAVNGFEARFVRDARFPDTTFEAPVDFDEATFGDDTSFNGARFANVARFRAATFNGKSNELDDNASFEGASFAAEAEFTQATFGHVDFRDATVSGDASFREAAFDGDADCSGMTFEGAAAFDEVTVDGDLNLEGATFGEEASFEGCELRGGARSLEDDVRLVEAVFEGPVTFASSRVRGVNATDATFGDEASFESWQATGDVWFEDADFDGQALFTEAHFDDDVSFVGARFHEAVAFRGAEFRGATARVQANARFDDARFEATADFTAASFTAASFEGTAFARTVDFTDSRFEEASRFRLEPTTNETYVDFTGASIKEGTITQPESAWVRYDFTNASLGSVSLSAVVDADRKQLLDYFRFCNTEFNEFDGYEFDFAAHTGYLDRNSWVLHEFDENRSDPEYAVPMDPEHVETTYLRAKTAASAAGQMKPAGEFRVKRQQHARRKYIDIARDSTTDLGTRLLNAGRAVENAFLGLTCGHGMRLARIVAVFLLFPMIPAMLYAFGGPMFLTGAEQLSSVGELATADGRATLYENIHFSYITFLTIGYGVLSPTGALARLLAGLEVYVNVILSGLVLYGLIKRSEI